MCIPGLFSKPEEPKAVMAAPIEPVQQAVAAREQASDPRRAQAAREQRRKRALASLADTAGGTVLGPATGGREAREGLTPLANAAALNRTLGA